MIKQYKSTFSSLGILVNLRGETVHVNFKPDVLNNYGLRGCSFSTYDEELQRAIEAHPDFLSGKRGEIWTDDPMWTDAPKEESVKTTCFDCKTVKEAQKILEAEPYNIPHTDVTSRAKIIAVAKKYNVSFPNL